MRISSAWLLGPWLIVAGVAWPATAPALAPQPWYLSLRPGVTRAEIVDLSRHSLTPRGQLEILALPPGEIEFEFRGEMLVRAGHRMDLARAAMRSIYGLSEVREINDLDARRQYLAAGDFTNMPRFAGGYVRTAKYECFCYEIDGQYLVAESIEWIKNGGIFDGKCARVLVVSDSGEEKTLYRAIDHWPALRPPNVSMELARQREKTLRQLGTDMVGKRISEVFGPPDARMGSGRDMRLYYLPTGLAMVGVGGKEPVYVDGKRTPYPFADYVGGIAILTPGIPLSVPLDRTFEAWLKSPPGAPQ